MRAEATSRGALAALGLAAALSLAAALMLGWSLLSEAASAADQAARAGSAPVKVKSFKYHPKLLTIPAGTTVVWRNKDSTVHTATDAGVFNTGRIKPGKKKTVFFETPGTYKYICKIH